MKVQHQEFFFEYQNYNVYTQYWNAPKANNTVVLIHGMGEHASRYTAYVIPQLISNNYNVIAFDNFGHGKSTGKRGHTPGYEQMLDLIDIVIERATSIFTHSSLFLYGHSMGGNLALNYILRRSHTIKGAIVTSPFLKLAFQPPLWKIILGKGLHKIAPSLTLKSGLDTSHISKDRVEVAKYEKDHLIHDKISPEFSFPVMEAGLWALEHSKNLKIPLFMAHGRADKITDHKASEHFAQMNNDLITLKLFNDGYHELHNDNEKEVLLESIVKWIKNVR